MKGKSKCVQAGKVEDFGRFDGLKAETPAAFSDHWSLGVGAVPS